MYKNTENSYGLIARLFHWIISFLVGALIAIGFYMRSMQNSPEKFELYSMHKSFGVALLLLVVLRIIWKIFNKAVLPVAELPYLFKLGAKIVHFMLYVFMIVMSISGIMMSRLMGYDISVFGSFTISALPKNETLASTFHTIHTTAIWGLVALIILHIAAAFYHHFIKKDNTLLRMLKENV